ncbi:MAG: FAD-binding oxidoreductase [Cyanobacteria bacterium P01_F01_bin.33]
MTATLPTTADVVVIGGGIIGTSIALHVARDTHARVVLLEQHHLGSGPTGRSLAVISQHYTHPALVTLARESLQIFRSFRDRYDGDCGFVETGLVVLVGSDRDTELRDAVALQQDCQVEVELLAPERLHDLDNRLFVEDVAIASYQPGAGYASPLQTMHVLRQAATVAGVVICEGVRATEIVTSDSAVTAVKTSAGQIVTPVVVDAAGPWGQAIARTCGILLPLLPCRQVMAAIARFPQFGPPHIAVNDFIAGTSFRAAAELTYVGWFDRSQVNDPIDPDNYDETIPGTSLVELAQVWQHRYPIGTATTVRVGGWSGAYDVTPDWMPICDRFGPEGFYACCGTSGHGFKFGPLFGQLVAQWIADGKRPRAELEVLRGDRFDH